MKRDMMGLIVKRDDGSEIVNYDDPNFPSYIYDGWIAPKVTWAGVPHYHEDIEILTSVKDKKIIVLLNKTDKEDEIIITKDNISKLLETVGVSSDVPVITTSMILGNGIDELKNAISDLFFNGKLVPEDEIYVTNLRHKNLLEKAYRSLCLVKNSVEQGLSEDFYTIDLHDAYESLGLIIGEEVGDDLVEEIFSKFCMGK